MNNLKFKFLLVIFFTWLLNVSELTAGRLDINILNLGKSQVLSDGATKYNVKHGPNGLSWIIIRQDGTQVQYFQDRNETCYPDGKVKVIYWKK
jgi:hypothetical protein